MLQAVDQNSLAQLLVVKYVYFMTTYRSQAALIIHQIYIEDIKILRVPGIGIGMHFVFWLQGQPSLLESDIFCCCGFKTNSGNKMGKSRLIISFKTFQSRTNKVRIHLHSGNLKGFQIVTQIHVTCGCQHRC